VPAGGGSQTNAAQALYTFSFHAIEPIAVQFRTVSTLSIWFPFVLDRAKRYTLTVRNIDPEIHEMRGDLKNNRLEFELPAFSMQARSIAQGEVDAAP
jgi:hypothetical protein